MRCLKNSIRGKWWGTVGGNSPPEGQQREIPLDYVCRLGIGWFSGRSQSDGAAPHHKMQDQRDHSEHQQQVNQPTRNVKYAKAGNPRNQQNHEQYCPNAHFTLLVESQNRFRLYASKSLPSDAQPVLTGHLVAAEKYICTLA